MIILFTNNDKHPITPPNVENYYDLAYTGIEIDFPEIKEMLPIKIKRNVEVTKQEKYTTISIVNNG